MPRIRTLTPGASPMHFFGSEVRRAREAAGMTQADLGALVPCDNSTVSRVEAGILAPDEAFALACDTAFPHVGGWFTRFYRECNGWSAPFPSWFEDWLKAEQEATTLRIWQPIIIPGLLQTPEYARALFLAGQDDTSDEAIGKLVAARMGRQAIFDKPDRPKLLVVLDEMVLHRLIGSPKIMHDQLVQLADMSARSYIAVQVVPASTGANAGLAGSFMIASFDGRPDLMYLDAVEGQTVESNTLIRKTAVVFDQVRADALPRTASRDLILKLAGERWNPQAATTGAKAATAETAALTA